jgi:hypothetical protein
VLIGGRKLDSFIRYPIDSNPMTWDSGAGAYMPAGTSSWDLAAKTVTFHVPRDYLAAAGITSPYFVSSQSAYGALSTGVVDDRAPEPGDTIGVANSRVLSAPGVSVGAHADTVTFQHAGGNTFFPQNSSFGTTPTLGLDPSHRFHLDVPVTSDVALNLTWTDGVGATDLDLYVTGAASSEDAGETGNPTERVILKDVQGRLDIRVDPYFVTDPAGSTYMLTATVDRDTDGDGINDGSDRCPDAAGAPPSGCPDRDGDGVIDPDDVCPDEPGNGADGCPIGATEHVHVYVDGLLTASQDVDTANGTDAFDIPLLLGTGVHGLRVDWVDDGEVLGTTSRTVVVATDAQVDTDGDGVNDAADNCPSQANAGQSDIDHDGKGDVCDQDMDGDGHANAKERAHGTDERDPKSYPPNGRTTSPLG